MRSREDLRGLQALPLDIKIMLTNDRIREWVETFGEDGVCVSFSGGKDSTVLLHLVRSEYPKIKAVFSDTGLEFPEIRNFVKTFDNVEWVKPEKTFGQIVTEYGYPMFGKEIAETIYYARKIRGGGYTSQQREQNGTVCAGKEYTTMGEEWTVKGDQRETTRRREKIQGTLPRETRPSGRMATPLFRRARGREQVDFQ